jgi:AcrR family transcriptional regulator
MNQPRKCIFSCGFILNGVNETKVNIGLSNLSSRVVLWRGIIYKENLASAKPLGAGDRLVALIGLRKYSYTFLLAKKDREGLQMKETIMEQSIQLFAQKGFKETSIQDIMNELNVTKGTFYYYFKNKEELLMDIHLQYIDRLLENQEAILADDTKSYQEKLYDIIFKLIHDIEKEGLSAKVFFREMRHLSEKHLEQIVSKRDRFKENIQQLVEEGMEAGQFRADLPSDIVTLGILGMANWSYFWFKPDGEKSDREVANIFYEMLVKGIIEE